MAAARIKHGSLVASTVKTEQLDNRYDFLEVTNVTGTAAIYFRAGGPGVCPNPTVGGDDCDVLAAVAGARVMVPCQGSPTVDVKLISAGTPGYSVAGRTGAEVFN